MVFEGWCSKCLEDPEVTSPKDWDAQCRWCGKKLCVNHFMAHLQEHYDSPLPPLIDEAP